MAEEQINVENPQLIEDISPEKNKAVLKTILKQGNQEEGKPTSGCTVYVHYIGRLETGEKFDSSRDRNEVFKFELGKQAVIKGWDIGVATMYKNEVCELKIASDYAYGAEGFPPKIPENATLIFEVELVSWDDEPVTDDGGVRKRIIKEGDSLNKPNNGASVKVHLRGTCEGVLFDERDVEFIIGEGYEHNIVDGIELAICKMKRHEKAQVFISSQYGFTDKGSEKFGIPPNVSELVYEICLFNFIKAMEIYEMNFEERIKNSDVLKARGLKCIKAGEYKKALAHYERVLQLVHVNKQDSDYPISLPYRIAANSNAALCLIKLGDYLNAQKYCEKVLKLDETNVKAHFRTGESLVGLHEYKAAVQSYERVLVIEPNNTAAKKQLELTRKMLKKQVEKEKKLYGNIFAKMGN